MVVSLQFVIAGVGALGAAILGVWLDRQGWSDAALLAAMVVCAVVVIVATLLAGRIGRGTARREPRREPEQSETANAPLLTADYDVKNVWFLKHDSEHYRQPVVLRNAGSRDAVRIVVPEMVIDARTKIEFRQTPIPEIKGDGGTYALMPDVVQRTEDGGWLLETDPFWKVLAGDVIEQHLAAGQKPKAWPIYFEYSDHDGNRFFTRGEFRCDDGLPRRIYFQYLSSGIRSEAVTP